MVKRAVNIRFRKDQLKAIEQLIAENPQGVLDRSKVVSMAVDEFLGKRRSRIAEEPPTYGRKKKTV